MEEIKSKAEKQKKDEKSKPSAVSLETSNPEVTEKNQKSRTSTASSAEQDLDTFLLGDLEDSDGGAGTFFEQLQVMPYISIDGELQHVFQ